MFHGVRNIVANLRVLLFNCDAGRVKGPVHCRIGLQIHRMLGVLCLFYHGHPLLDIYDSNAAEKWKEFELKLGRIYSIAMKFNQEPKAVQVATLLSVVEAEVRKVFAMFTDWASNTNQTRFSLCYKSLQRTISHLKMCLLKDISFILECRNRESLMITIRQLFNS